MTPRDKATLKTFFEQGDVPTQTHFEDLIDSMLTLEDIETPVPADRVLAAQSPLRIDGEAGADLSQNRTLSILPATNANAGSMSAVDKAKLDAISGTNTGDQTLEGLGGIAHSLATAANDFLVASGVGQFVKKTFAETITILRTSLDSVYAAITHTHDYTDLTNKPTLGTASSRDVPPDGFNADADEVVLGNDGRLSDTRDPKPHNQAESSIDFTDITTGDASAAKHGFLPKLANDITKFLRGDGTWAIPVASAAWGLITGTLSNQTDLQNALNAKANSTHQHGGGDVTSAVASATNSDTVDNVHVYGLQRTYMGCVGADGRTFDSSVTQGQYMVAGTNVTGAPYGGTIYGVLEVKVQNGNLYNGVSDWIWQDFVSSTNYTYFRSKINAGAWTPWYKKWTSVNGGPGSELHADTVDNVHADVNNVANTAVVRNASRYIYADYICTAAAGDNGGAVTEFYGNSANGSAGYHYRIGIGRLQDTHMHNFSTIYGASGSCWHTSAVSLPNNTWGTAITYHQGQNKGPWAIWNASYPTRLTVPVTGVYWVSANVPFAASNTTPSSRYLAIRLNGGVWYAITGGPQAIQNGYGVNLFSGVLLHLSAGLYCEVFAYQNTGGALNLNYDGSYPDNFSMTFLGAY